MTPDPIVAEVRRARDEYARRFNYDLRAMFQDIKRREGESEWPLVNRSGQPDLNNESRPSLAPVKK